MHLLDDLELLRRQLGIEKWLGFGGSWGSVLGLVYARQYPVCRPMGWPSRTGGW